MSTFTEARLRTRLVSSLPTPEDALCFLRSLITDNDLPREEMLVLLSDLCERFPPPNDPAARQETPSFYVPGDALSFA